MKRNPKILINNGFARHLLSWYGKNKRELPWRRTKDPYRIWLSEIILQQTRVNQGLPYYNRFLEQFPSLRALATSSERKVLKAWEGLGYYTRARNLHRCAKEIYHNRRGEFPGTMEELLTLPGVGHYTAAAIASFAFGENVSAVDGNVIRVVTRLYRIGEEITKNSTREVIFRHANNLLPKSNGALYNQAMMELGSKICKPKKPACIDCPVNNYCLAFHYRDAENFPLKKKKVKVRKRYFNYLILKSNKKILMKKREGNDIWKGLYEFLLIESEKASDPSKILDEIPSGILNDPVITYESRPIKHILSHQEIVARFIEINQSGIGKLPDKTMKYYRISEIENLPKSVLIANYLEERSI